MGFVGENAKRSWDTEAEYHRGLRDRFAGQYDPPPAPVASAESAEDVDAAREAYDAGYHLGEITP